MGFGNELPLSTSSSPKQCSSVESAPSSMMENQSLEDDGKPPESSNAERIQVISQPQFESGVYDGPEFNSPAFSYLSPKIQCRKCDTGAGLFVIKKIKKDELILGWAGKVVHVDEVKKMSENERTYILQIDDELFQIPFWKGYNEPADFVNHSCNPNTGFRNSPIVLGAMRDLEVGEQITFDYAMAECVNGLKGNEFECSCGAHCCRGKFTGADWMIPELWERYGDYFSPYLLKKIKALQAERAETPK